jgi:hypothetical protein
MASLRHLDPPDDDLRAAEAGLRRVSESGAASSHELRRTPPERLRLTHPLPVYVLGLDDLRERRDLRTAQHTGWRYLVEASEAKTPRPLALARTIVSPDGAHQFASLNYGPFVAGTADAIRAAERMTLPDSDLRVLEVPALYLVVLWLDHGQESTLIPIAPTPPDIEANHAYEARELLDLLVQRASRLPDLDAPDERGL